jgi:hypothetical protein
MVEILELDVGSVRDHADEIRSIVSRNEHITVRWFINVRRRSHPHSLVLRQDKRAGHGYAVREMRFFALFQFGTREWKTEVAAGQVYYRSVELRHHLHFSRFKSRVARWVNGPSGKGGADTVSAGS